MQRYFYLQQVEVNSIDGFQCREKDVIILSCVRSAGTGRLPKRAGFLDDPQRLNVAMSRAKCWIVAVGDLKLLTLENHFKNWPKYLPYFRKTGLPQHSTSADNTRPPVDTAVNLPVTCGFYKGCKFCETNDTGSRVFRGMRH